MKNKKMKNQKKLFITYFAIMCVLILTTISTAQAATFTVNVTSDMNDTNPGDGICHAAYRTCTLRAAIQEANALAGSDNIVFSTSFKAPNPPKTIVLSLSTLIITDDLTIDGTGARQLMIDGNHQFRILNVNATAGIVQINYLTVQNGYSFVKPFTSPFAAGIANQANLILNGVTVRNNDTLHEDEPWLSETGGGISNNGFLNLINSTVTGNKAGLGGGVYNGGVFYAYNSTISDKKSYWGGAGVYFNNHFVAEVSYLRNTTIANNYAQTQSGGGIYMVPNGKLQMANTIVANNFAQSDNDLHGTFISGGNNIVKNRGASAGYVAADLPDGTDPMLAPLSDYGGSTDTRALLSGSPAIDAGNDCIVVVGCSGDFYYDQRGYGFHRKTGSAVDIGAFEFQGRSSAIVQIGGKVSKENGRGLNKAVVTLIDADGATRTTQTDPNGYFRFDEVATGESYVIQAESRQHNYAPQTLFVTETREDVNFVPVVTR
jgi:CSLREA domain-containing protein